MSTTIDNKIVEMSFNNSDFEKNAQQSIETTEKLKKSLDFDGVGKGLEQIGTSAKKIDLSPIATAAETVGEKFDAMKYIAIFALQDIYNMATRTAAQLVNTFAIQPVSSGFSEYELKMGSIQTIMASTSASLTDVNAYLDELNLYADKTIYSFADMTNNIGKFTNAGVDLKTAVAAIQGISNEAAVSGANTNEASRAMYNFAQALSAGYVKLIDWKSIENANMATVEFKNELIKTATELGNLEQQADGTYKVLTQSSTGSSMDEAISATQNFNDSLQYQWMTTDVLTTTLARYADETTEIGKKAFAAATEVKTFSMMMDTLTEAAGSGWTESWEILVGDFEQAKKFWTKLTDYFSDVIESMSTARNNLLEGVFENGFDLIEDKVDAAGITVEDFEKKIKELGTASGLSMDEIIEKSGSLGQAFADGAISTDIITQAITDLAASAELGEDKTKALNNAASAMFDGLQEKSGRTLLQESLYNTLDSIKIIIESITTAWDRVEEGFTSSKLYDVIQKVNGATAQFKQYISDNLADPWLDVESAITDSGMSMDDFQKKLIEIGNQNGVDVQSMIDEYGSLQNCFEAGVLSGDLVIKMFEDMGTQTEVTTTTVTTAIEGIEDVLADYQDVVHRVWMGEFKNAPERYQLLADAGYDYVKVQELVNRTVDQHTLTLEDLNAVGIETTKTTQEQNEALIELANSAKESGTSINAALNKLGKKTGLQLAVESAHDAFVSLKIVAQSAAESFKHSFFDGELFNKVADDAYSAISYINQQTSQMSEYVTTNIGHIKSSFSGVFDSIKTIAVAFYKSIKKILEDTSMYDGIKSTLAGAISWINKQINKLTSYISSHGDEIEQTLTGIMKLAKSIGKDIAAVISGVVKVLGKLFDNITDSAPDVLDITSNIGKFFEALADGVDVSEQITAFFDGLVKKLPNVVQVIQDVWNTLKDVPVIGSIITSGENIWAGISDGAWEEIQKIESGEVDIQSAIVGVGETIVDAMATAAQYVKDNGIQGIIDVFKNGQISISEGLTGISGAVTEPSNEIVTGVNDFLDKLGQAAMAIAPIVGAFAVLKGVADTVTQFANAIKTLAGPIESVTNLLQGCTGLIKTLQTQITDLGKAVGFAIRTEAFINLAICIGIIAGVMVILAEVAKSNPEGMQQAIYAVVGIVVAMALVMAVISEMRTSQIKKIQKVSQAAMELAGMIAILAGIVVVLSMLDQGALIQGLAGLFAVLVMLGVFIAAIAFIGGKFGNTKVAVTFDKVAQTVLAIAVSFLIIAAAIKLMCTCDTDRLNLATVIFSFFMIFLGVLMGAMAYISSNAAQATVFGNLMTKVGNSIKLIGEAFMFLGVGIFLIGQLSQEQLDRASTMLLAFAGFVTVLLIVCAVASKISAGQMATFSTSILGMVAAIGIMALLAVALGYVDPARFVIGVGLLAIVSTLCVAMYGVMLFITSKCKAEKIAKMGLSLLAMTVCIGIMAAIAVLLGYCDQSKLAQGIGFVTVLVGLASVMALAASQLKSNDIAAIAAIAAAVAILAVIAIAFTMLDPASLAVAVGALSTLMICFGILALCMSTLSKVKAPVAQVALLIVILAAIGGVVYLLCSLPNVDQAQNAAIAIAALMLSMAGMMYVISAMSTRMALAGKQISQMIPVIAIAIGIMAACAILIAIICAVGGENTDKAVEIAGAIGVLMLTLAASLEAFSHIKSSSISGQTVATLAILVGALALVGIVIGVLCNTIGNRIAEAYAISAALALMLGVLTTCAVLLAKFSDGKTLDTNVVKSLGVLVAALAVVGLVIGVMVGVLPTDKIAVAYQAALALSLALAGLTACAIALSRLNGTAKIDNNTLWLLGVLSLCMVPIGLILGYLTNAIGSNASAALPAAGALAIALIGIVAAAAILCKFSANGVEPAGLGTALAVILLLTVCFGIVGTVLATLISAVAPNVDAALPTAVALSAVLLALAGATVILSNYHGNFLTGISAVGVLSALVLALVGVLGIIGGINDLLGGGLETAVSSAMNVFYSIAQGLGRIIEGIGVGQSQALVTIANNTATAMIIMNTACMVIDENNINKIKLFGEALLALGAGEIVSAIGNLVGLSAPDLVTTLTDLGKGVAAFAGELTGVDTAVVEQGGNAAKALCESLSAIPMEGGFLDSIFGTHQYGKFAEGVTAIGEALPAFVNAVGDINTDTVQPSCEALNTLMECFKNLPNSGGVLQGILGDVDYSKFAEGMKSVGEALPKYVEAVGGTDTSNVQPSVDALKYLLDGLEKMPEEGGWINVITGGKMSLSDFSTELPKLGTAISGFCTNIGDVDVSKMSGASQGMKHILYALDTINDKDIQTSKIETFKNSLNKLAEIDVKKLTEAFSDIDLSSVSEFGKKIDETLSGSIGENTESVTNSINTLLNSVTTAFQNGLSAENNGGISLNTVVDQMLVSITNYGPKFTTVGNVLGTAFNTGFNQSLSSATGLSITLQNSLATIVTYVPQFMSAGMNLSTNLSTGFNMGLITFTATLTMSLASMYATVTSFGGQLYSAGSTLSTQLANGFTAGMFQFTAAAMLICTSASVMILGQQGIFYADGLILATRLAAGITSGSTLSVVAFTRIITLSVALLTTSALLFRTAGTTLVNMLATGINQGQTSIRVAVSNLISTANSTIQTMGNGSFKIAGYNAGLGFAEGLENSHYAVRVAAREMARVAVEAAQKELAEHSPSKVFFGIGDFAGQGLANGMLDTRDLVERSAAKLAHASVRGYNEIAGSGLYDFNTAIVPTVDYSAISANAGRLDFSATINRLVAEPVKTTADRLAESEEKFQKLNAKISDGLDAMRTDLASYTEAISGTENAIYVDGKKLASSIAKPMNQQLGVLSRRGV